MYVYTLCLFLVVSNVSAQCNSRIRKSWDNMTPSERNLYKRAVEAAMDSQYHAMFTEIHAEALSEAEAHQTCGFLIWHRRYLLAYENMLRSLSAEFACVTIPYWNYFRDYAKRQNGECRTLEDCSTILQPRDGLGGSRGRRATANIAGRRVTGRCVSQSPLNHFCENSNTSESCLGCLPRGNWRSTRFPSGLGYASLVNVIADTDGYFRLTLNLQYGPHNTIHNAAGGTMATLVSPADPLFYSHHAMVDLLYHVYFECHVGRYLSTQEKQTNRWAFQSCSLPDVEGPRSTSDFQMRWQTEDAHRHELLAPFFDGMSTQYYDYVDNFDLGWHSYSYEMDQVITSLLDNGLVCPSQSRRRLQSSRRARDTFVASSQAETRMVNWYHASYNKLRKNASKETCFKQLEQTECQYHQEELGGIEEFSEVFKQAFHVDGHPRCQSILDETIKMEEGNKPLGDLYKVLNIPNPKRTHCRLKV